MTKVKVDWTKDNISLGQIKHMLNGEIFNAVQISEDTVRLWNQTSAVFLSLQHYKDAIYQDRFREID